MVQQRKQLTYDDAVIEEGDDDDDDNANMNGNISLR